MLRVARWVRGPTSIRFVADDPLAYSNIHAIHRSELAFVDERVEDRLEQTHVLAHERVDSIRRLGKARISAATHLRVQRTRCAP